LHQRLAADIRRAGGRTVLVSAQSATSAYRVPPVAGAAVVAAEILPLQMMTLACAAGDPMPSLVYDGASVWVANKEAAVFQQLNSKLQVQ
jgi:hypothetical protein